MTQDPCDFATAEHDADSREQAVFIAERETARGYLCHIEGRDTGFTVYVATKTWVDNYYRSGGAWGYHRYYPEVGGWFPG